VKWSERLLLVVDKKKNKKKYKTKKTKKNIKLKKTKKN